MCISCLIYIYICNCCDFIQNVDNGKLTGKLHNEDRGSSNPEHPPKDKDMLVLVC